MTRLALLVLAASWLLAGVAHASVPLVSAHAIVVDESTGVVLLGKDTRTSAPIASLTKLMTAMLVLDAAQDPDELLQVDDADVDRLKHTRSGVPVGTVLPRAALLELALIASDNRAASALARHHPGGMDGFVAAAQRKIETLGLVHTVIEEPTGLSPANRASAEDMARLLHAAAGYPAIAEISSRPAHAVTVNGRPWAVRNTNRLVGAPGWHILLSKTGFTREAGRCVTMRMHAAGRTVAVVLMGAAGPAERALDALNIRRWLDGQPPRSLRSLPPEGAPAALGAARRRPGLVRLPAPAKARA